ncbi:hypothetical protein H4F51_14370 [Pectobacterium brasiliense]|uniref:hypothetical protein n=1 Tax=Pectobacterium brasiliense TaxID=180957 RepID=UPI0015DFFDE9|nr:hypothetical protein [Pectobacterium brasiliense]MBA0196328.1 hypothetical protein [Pectobacterium brasiliense]MBN3093252.1 hypothetical protein [Pectobacterium brasiliense]MBN3141099.1 hypothetical protein [Pectobacterium brasiliense]MBW5896121.1 hypothetical protein [Pectobacterium brasiliense]
MEYQSIRLNVNEGFQKLCAKHDLMLSKTECFSASTTMKDIIDFVYQVKDANVHLALLAYIAVEWLKGRKGRKIHIAIENEKLKEITAENVSKEELESILTKTVALFTNESE